MHQLAFGVTVTARKNKPVSKGTFGTADLEIVADLVSDGIREGSYVDIFPTGNRPEIIQFLQRLATKCEFRQRDPVKGCLHNRVAALLIYSVEDTVVGFSVLAESLSDSTRNYVELVMIGVVPLKRGLGYGAFILDSVINTMSQQHFNLVVKCPSDNQLLFAMLVTRGFVSFGRICKGRLLRLAPLINKGHSGKHIHPFLGVE